MYLRQNARYIFNVNTNQIGEFLDAHNLKGVNEKTLRNAQNSPKDEFGVTHDNMMYNREEDKWYCRLDAPDRGAIVKHHEKHGIKCDWITEVKTTKWV